MKDQSEHISFKYPELPRSCSLRGSINYVPIQMGKEKTFEADDKESISSESETDIAPDGGWGWMVCFGAFMINFIVDGTMMSFGVILLELLDCYGESKAKTAWVGSTLFGTSMIMGPFVGFLLERYSCRQVTIAGSLISVFGFISSMFAPNIAVLIITYGVIGGIGFCMMFITSIIATSLYFTKKRALANGIAMSGGGMGIFVYGNLCNFLLSIYNWQNTLLILSGILLNCIVFGSLFRPLIAKNNIRSPNLNKTTCLCLSDDCSTSEGSTYDEYIPSNKRGLFHSDSLVSPGYLHQSEFSLPVKSDAPYVRGFSSNVSLSSFRDKATLGYIRPMMRKDIFYSGSIHNIPSLKDTRSVSSIIVSLTKDFTDSEASYEDSSTSSFSLNSSRKLTKLISRKLKIFKDARFTLLLISCILWTAQSTVVTYLPDMAGTKDVPRSQCAMLISVIGISNTVAKIVSGFISDFFHVPSTYIYAIALFIAGAVNLALPWCDGFELLAFCSCMFGFCMGSTIALRTIVITDHLGIEKLTRAFGMIAMFQGIAFLVNPPLGGLVFDLTDSYIYPFLMVGLMYLLSGVMCVPLFRKSRALRRESFEVILQDTQVIEPLCIDSKPPLFTEDITCQHKNPTTVVINLDKVIDSEVSETDPYLSQEQVKCPSG